jgi:hypothetical protein
LEDALVGAVDMGFYKLHGRRTFAARQHLKEILMIFQPRLCEVVT